MVIPITANQEARFEVEFPFIRHLSISDLELNSPFSAEPVSFGIAFGSYLDSEALADNHFRNYLLHRSGRQLSLPLDLRFAVLLAHNRFLFSSASNGGKLSNPVSLRNSCFVGINNKPPSLRPSGFVFSFALDWDFSHLTASSTKGFYILLPNSSMFTVKICCQAQL